MWLPRVLAVCLAAMVAASAAEAQAPPQDEAPTAPAQSGGPAEPDVVIINQAGRADSGTPSKATAAPPSSSDAAATSAAADEPPPMPPEEAAAPPPPPVEPTLVINIDLTQQRMRVSENGEGRFVWRISSARYGYNTPTGTFKPTWMSSMWYSRQYDMAPMPHAIFFHKGVAIHGSYATSQLGQPASHGCVRLSPRNAATLYKLVGLHGKDHTKIIVHGKPIHRFPQVAEDERYGQRYAFRRGYAYPSPYFDGYDYEPYYEARPPRARYTRPTRHARRGYYRGYYTYGYGF